MARTKPKTRTEQRKERAALEKKFLSAVLADIDFTDIRMLTLGYNDISWRYFADKRHQALWRALQTVELSQSLEERVETLMVEMGFPRDPEKKKDAFDVIKDLVVWRILNPNYLSMELEKRIDISMEDKKLISNDAFVGRGKIGDIMKKANNMTWLERELAAAGVLPLIGKVYLREICEEYPVGAAADNFAKKLGFKG